jgi:hypothetical protein
MSYLGSLRLHFAGRFQAAPSTVNNDPLHYNNKTFKPQYQERQKGKAVNGKWNPMGSAAFRLIDCSVTCAWRGGTQVSKSDPVTNCLVADSDTRTSAKIVDLDPEQQLVSEIWGLELRICDKTGTTLVKGNFRPAPFLDIWDRSQSGSGDAIAGASYQSVLTGVDWPVLRQKGIQSEFLKELHKMSETKLSIKFNLDGYNMDYESAEFTCGRIVGTIGPHNRNDPEHFVFGRHLMPAAADPGGFFRPSGKINFCSASLDDDGHKLFLDLGNAIPTRSSGGEPVDLGLLILAVLNPPSQPLILSDLPYLSDNWYENSAGIFEVNLCDDQLAQVKSNRLALLKSDADGVASISVSEPQNGLYMRADKFVFRLSPGESASVRLYASKWGKPYSEARVISIFDPSQLQMATDPKQSLAVGEPKDALAFSACVLTKQNGVAYLEITAKNPNNPRGYIDGQIYGIRPMLEETIPSGSAYPFNPWDFISILVWDEFAPKDVSWNGCVRDILIQYANLYPIMRRFVDLSNYQSVCEHRELLDQALNLPEEDPNFMPVSRDLSPAKREAISRWLKNELPPIGFPPQPHASEHACVTFVAELKNDLQLRAMRPALELAEYGGKYAASQRRKAAMTYI